MRAHKSVVNWSCQAASLRTPNSRICESLTYMARPDNVNILHDTNDEEILWRMLRVFVGLLWLGEAQKTLQTHECDFGRFASYQSVGASSSISLPSLSLRLVGSD